MSESDAKLLYDAETIQQKVADLGRRIEAEHADTELLVIAILGGSVVFLADLVRAIRQPIIYDFVQVQYSATGPDGDVLEIQYPISLDVSDQTLIVLKDVVATGVIETYLSSQFQQRGARSVRFAALIDLPEERRTDFNPDYPLFTPRRPGSFVGYGLKYRGRYGNLGYIGRLAGE